LVELLKNHPIRSKSKFGYDLTAGHAVIINRVGDLPDLLEKENAAYIVGQDPSEMVEGCLRLFNDSHWRIQIENEARRVSREILSWEKITQDIEKFYHKIMGGEKNDTA